jgi:HK97 family phage prohead protease
MKDYIQSFDKAERRFLSVELRSKEGRTVEGYAAKFNSDSEVFYNSWLERIAPGAFDNVMADDAVALFNHDPNFILARNKVNMTLTQDETGLKYSFEAPNTTAGNDLLENLKNGNIRQSSFAFTVAEEKWKHAEKKGDLSVRTITKVERLYDVSPVTYPAYPDTTVGKRSFDAMNQQELEKENQAKAYLIEVEQKKHELFKLKK